MYSCAGMLEMFLQELNLLTDDDVMELLTFLFHGEVSQKKLDSLIEKRKQRWQRKIARNTCPNKGTIIHHIKVVY